MKNTYTLFLALLLLGFTAAARAPPEAGWVSLFNGTDLSGWKNNGEEKWIVEHGTIFCESTANKYGYLTTEKPIAISICASNSNRRLSATVASFSIPTLPATIRSTAPTLRACR